MKPLAVFFSLIILLCCAQNDNGIDKTVRRLEERDAKAFKRTDDPQIMILSRIREKRIENGKKDFLKYLEITKDIDRCIVIKTIDTDDYVITLIDSDGRKCSLWLRGDRVRTITPY